MNNTPFSKLQYYLTVLLLTVTISYGNEPLSLAHYAYNPHVSLSVWDDSQHYLLPANNPIRPMLDKIFTQSRPLNGLEDLRKAGFKIISNNSRNHVVVASHKRMKGYIFKMILDDQNVNEYRRLKNRIIGANLIRDSIQNHGFQDLFKVAKKWLYPLPVEAPTAHLHFYQKNFILVVENVKPLKSNANKVKWASNKLETRRLNALYILLQENGLNDCIYAFNIPFCKDKRNAFVDTEDFGNWPIYLERLQKYFCSSRKQYWLQLVNQGGP